MLLFEMFRRSGGLDLVWLQPGSPETIHQVIQIDEWRFGARTASLTALALLSA